jgi:hypothetical protein
MNLELFKKENKELTYSHKILQQRNILLCRDIGYIEGIPKTYSKPKACSVIRKIPLQIVLVINQ